MSAGMAAMFTFVISSALYHNLEITCGCFGVSSTEIINYSILIRACMILLLAAIAYSGMLAVNVKSEPVKSNNNNGLP
ncbi:MauE/DoxX family redox-associated membrane protein [Planctomycetota bacterium]